MNGPHFTSSSLLTRYLDNSDLPELCRIEIDSFENAWSALDFKETMSQAGMIGILAQCKMPINCGLTAMRTIGYLIYHLNRTGAEIINFAVDPPFRRRRAGTLLIQQLISKLHDKRAAIVLNIREQNLTAQIFFKKLGFRAIAIAKNYFIDEVSSEETIVEDAYTFQYVVPECGGDFPEFSIHRADL